MSLSKQGLAQDIANAMGHLTISDTLLGISDALVEELQKGSATFGGTPSGHQISGLINARLAVDMADATGLPTVSNKLLGYCSGILNYIMLFGTVTYTGPASPPSSNWFLGGTISNLDATGMANMIMIELGKVSLSEELVKHCEGICSHIMENAEVVSGVIS